MGEQDRRFEAGPQTENLMMPWQIFANYSQRPLAKMMSGSSNITSVRRTQWEGIIVEIQVPGHINFKWNHSNL